MKEKNMTDDEGPQTARSTVVGLLSSIAKVL